MKIFYFTGTGNSLFVARKIAAEFDAELISIPQVVHEQKTYSDNVIGFVYPQYAESVPKMVRQFVLNNTFKADYIFVIDLYAFIRINALGEMAAILPVNFGMYLKTPFNFIHLYNTPKNPSAKLKKTEQNLKKIIADIKNRKNNTIKPRKGIGNATKYFGKAGFKVTNACTKCSICVNVCPGNNILIDDDVSFGNNCENCYACINLCPTHAIYSNKASLKRRQYRNPDVSLKEIIEANQNER